ncbi:alanine racemase [Candidatus Gracilibacteria bacterium]|nr:alanine racemase [Candidatus Gracilibacteria bacterium]
MIGFLRKIFLPHPEPMNMILIHKKNILNNLEVLQSLQPKSEIFPVLKSNAYGHGLKQITKIIKKLDVPYLVVDSFPEYMIVKKYTKQNILLLGETLPDNYRYFDFKRTTFCISNMEALQEIGKLRKGVRIHLFLNTGMNREGIDEDNLDKFIEVLKQYPNIELEGVMSHLHSADNMYSNNIEQQIDLFKKLYYKIVNAGYTPIWRHIGNSAGLMKIKDDFFNAYRPGLAMYGYNPLNLSDENFNLGKKLKPALSILSTVISKHNLKYGDGVSYGHTYRSMDSEVVANIPFGYAEGLARSVSGKILFKIGKKYFKQIGTICMNLSSFLIDKSVNLYDEVEIISENQTSKNTVKNLVDQNGMLIYEFLVGLDKGIRREVV